MENKEIYKLERAHRRVAQIRGFYNHLGIFVVINTALLLLKDKMTVWLLGKEALNYPDAMDWIYWNAYVWVVILAIHALLVFGKIPFFVKKWEDRQMERYLKEDQKKKKYE
ncbi:MAG: 2TM domain-containing protein [Maribacter sp.]|uniref:2TM domain-containing protein n=1 Tax=Maribacter sp. TaxID=1897614 RepID=UPI003C74C666